MYAQTPTPSLFWLVYCLSSICSLTSVWYTVGPSPLFFLIVEAALLNTTPRGKGLFLGALNHQLLCHGLFIEDGTPGEGREVRRFI